MSKRSQLVWQGVAATVWFVVATVRLIPPPTLLHHFSLSGYHAWAFSHLAYSDIISLYQRHQLTQHPLPYIQTPIEYPVLMGITMWLTSWAGGILGYFLATAVVLWLAALGTIAALNRRSPRAGWTFAMSPMLITFGLLNWDVLGIFLLVCAVRLWETNRMDGSAVMFATAVFFKFFPAFYLPFLAWDLVIRGKMRRLARFVGVFGLTSAVINAPFALGNWNNWSLFFTFNAHRRPVADLWNNVFIHVSSVSVVNAASLAAVAAAALAAGIMIWRGGSLHQAVSMVFAIFLISNKVFSPQYMLWLLAFGALADWPAAALWGLSLGGVADYLNSFTMLHFARAHDRAAAHWYGETLFPMGLLVRYSAIAAGLTASQAKSSHTLTRRLILMGARINR